MIWYVYIIYSGNNTYVGSTNNLVRRLRQHNGEIVGGAKATKKATDWKYLAYITGFKDHKNCLSCEWRLKHPVGTKSYGVSGRIKALNSILTLDKWSSKCTVDNKDCEYTVHIKEDYIDKIDELQNVNIITICQ